MKTNIRFMVAILAIVVSLSSCKKVDPIWGTKPVDKTYAAAFPLDEFHRLGIAGDTAAQKKMIDQYRKQLTKNVLNHYPRITDEKHIRFVLGSGLAKKVKSGDGKTYNGDFKNELIIILNDPSVKDTVFLACGNGMLCPLELTHSSDLGTGAQFRFTIKKGESLATYLPSLNAWAKVAGDLKIPIRNKKGNIVSKETYLNYLGRYRSVLFTGDVIDVAQGKVFNKAGQEVDFKIRLAETKEANKRLLDKAIEKRIKADIARHKAKQKHRK